VDTEEWDWGEQPIRAREQWGETKVKEDDWQMGWPFARGSLYDNKEVDSGVVFYSREVQHSDDWGKTQRSSPTILVV